MAALSVTCVCSPRVQPLLAEAASELDGQGGSARLPRGYAPAATPTNAPLVAALRRCAAATQRRLAGGGGGDHCRGGGGGVAGATRGGGSSISGSGDGGGGGGSGDGGNDRGGSVARLDVQRRRVHAWMLQQRAAHPQLGARQPPGAALGRAQADAADEEEEEEEEDEEAGEAGAKGGTGGNTEEDEAAGAIAGSGGSGGAADVLLLGDRLALARACPFAFHGLTALSDALAAACGGVQPWAARRAHLAAFANSQSLGARNHCCGRG